VLSMMKVKVLSRSRLNVGPQELRSRPRSAGRQAMAAGLPISRPRMAAMAAAGVPDRGPRSAGRQAGARGGRRASRGRGGMGGGGGGGGAGGGGGWGGGGGLGTARPRMGAMAGAGFADRGPRSAGRRRWRRFADIEADASGVLRPRLRNSSD